MTVLRALPLIAVLTLSLLTLSLSACSSSAQRRCQDCLTRALPEGPLSAQTLSTKAQKLLKAGRAAQQRQDYARAYDLHRQALWALQAKQRLFTSSEDDPQELELRQRTLPKLQTQATISASVLGWASVLIEQANSPYMLTTLRLDLIEAYALLGEQQKVNQQLLQLHQGEAPHSFLTQRIEKAQRLAKTPPASTKALIDALSLGLASAHLADPMMLRAQARQALTSLWPPQLFRRGALETWAENQRLRDLLTHGESKDLALSVALYCHQSRDTCLSTFKQHAAKRKDDALMAQAQLLNLAFFYAEQDANKRILLMWSYYWLARDRGEMALAGAWLEHQGLPLIIKSPMNRRKHKQLIGAAERLFEHGQDATALKLLAPLERQTRQVDTTEQLILAYAKHKDVETALRIFDNIEPDLQSAELLATLLERLASRGDSSQLGRLDMVKAPTARYQALTKVATALALQADTSTAKALLKQATNIKELPPAKLDHAYLDGALHHLRALIALKDDKAAMSLAQTHIKTLAREPTAATQLYPLAQLATTAGVLGQEAIFELAIKAYIQQRSTSPNTSTREDELIELLVEKKRYKLMGALINSHVEVQQRSRALSWLISIVEKLHDEQQLIIEPALLEHLKEQVLELAKAQSVYGELARFSALSAKLKQPQLAADLARTLYSAAAYQNKHQYSLKVAAGTLIKQGAPEQGMQLYDELKTDYERLELLRTLSQNIDQGPDKARAQRLLQDLIARTQGLPKARQEAARAFVPLALANLNECERAVEALDPTIKVTSGTADDELSLAAKACLYAHKPAQALQLIAQLHLATNKAMALIQVGYYMDLSGQSRLPEVQAILKRAAKTL